MGKRVGLIRCGDASAVDRLVMGLGRERCIVESRRPIAGEPQVGLGGEVAGAVLAGGLSRALNSEAHLLQNDRSRSDRDYQAEARRGRAAQVSAICRKPVARPANFFSSLERSFEGVTL